MIAVLQLSNVNFILCKKVAADIHQFDKVDCSVTSYLIKCVVWLEISHFNHEYPITAK